jgi:SAM-dependent methyltransferase
MNDTWKDFFSHPDYTRFAGAIVGPERTRSEVRNIIDLLGLGPGGRILDLGCGNGRLAIPLAQAGYEVTGLDACQPLIEIARQSAGWHNAKLSLINADMKEFRADRQFDAVINIGTAFGYVASTADHKAALRNVFEALAPGGTFLLETENRDHRVTTDRRIWFEMAGTLVWCDRGYDAVTGRWHERIDWLSDGKREHTEYSVRLYTLAELVSMVSDAGFTVKSTYGELSGIDYQLDSPRTVVLAQKPQL